MTDRESLSIGAIPGLEPEEQPVVREVATSVALRGDKTGELLGRLNSRVEITKSAHEVASGLRRICANCKNFDRDKAQQIFSAAKLTQDGQVELRNLHSNLVAENLSGGAMGLSIDDVVNACWMLGYCHAFSKVDNDVIVHPLSNCPTESPHLGFSDRFEPIDRAAVKRGDAGYDQIMEAAQGKTP